VQGCSIPVIEVNVVVCFQIAWQQRAQWGGMPDLNHRTSSP
jgi:hypothetical protein